LEGRNTKEEKIGTGHDRIMDDCFDLIDPVYDEGDPC
jgi:hypothetical protein